METVYCGVDLHYGTSTFRFLKGNGETKQDIEIATDRREIEKLLNGYGECKVAYAFEAGGMARYFHRIIEGRKNTEKIHVVHPYKFKVITESKHKNDREDSLSLAKGLLKDYLPRPVYVKSDICCQIKTLLNLRRRMVGTRTRIILQAKSILRGLGIKGSQKSLTGKRGFDIVISQLNDEPFYRAIIESLSEECLAENTKIIKIEGQVKDLIGCNFKQEYEWLISIPGISFVTASTILSVIDDINRFDKAGQFSSYCGLIPSEHSSGENIVRGKITKEGVKELRSLLIQSAWSIVRWKRNNDERTTRFRKKYYRMSYKQKNTQKAVIAIARHLSRIVFGVLKNKTPYHGGITDKAKACVK